MSRPRFVLLCVGILLGALLLAEGLARWRADIRFGDVQDVYDLFEPVPGTDDLLRPIPGLSAVFAGRTVTIDSRGFRSPELRDPPPDGRLLLAFLGGSTTFCSNVEDDAHTWPALATARLRDALPDRVVEHVNLGATGYGVEHSRRALDLRLGDLRPDVTVIYHATNDLARDSEVVAREAGLLPEASEPDALEDVSLLWMLIRKNQRYLAAQAAGRDANGKLDVPATAWSGGFRERLADLVRAAQARSRLVVLPTFATLVRADQPREEQLEHLAQSFTFMPYLTPEATIAAYEEYDRVIREVAAETGALLVEAAHAIPGDTTHFADSVHLTEAGCDVLARLVVEALLASPDARPLLDG